MFKTKEPKIIPSKTTEEAAIIRSKQKRFFLRRVIKDIKRVRWPDNATIWKNLGKIIIFTVILVIFVAGISYGFSELWKTIHIS